MLVPHKNDKEVEKNFYLCTMGIRRSKVFIFLIILCSINLIIGHEIIEHSHLITTISTSANNIDSSIEDEIYVISENTKSTISIQVVKNQSHVPNSIRCGFNFTVWVPPNIA